MVVGKSGFSNITNALRTGGGSRLDMSTDEALAQVDRDKTLFYIKAWEDKQRAHSNNKFDKAVAKITAWENAKKAEVELKMRQSIQDLERKKAVILERMKNEMAESHRLAQQKVARAQAERQEELVKINEEANKYRTKGTKPMKSLLCFEA